MPGPQYFDRTPAVGSATRTVLLHLADLEAELTTDRGVFSGSYIDLGTLVLLKKAPAPPATGNLLDLGCGYGPIAVALAHRSPEATVWAVDINERAVALTAANAERLGLSNVRAVLPDDVPADLTFDAIYSNPPIRVGKESLHELLYEWLGRMTHDGVAYLVVQKHLGSDSLARWLHDAGFPTARLGSQKGYRILEVVRRERDQ